MALDIYVCDNAAGDPSEGLPSCAFGEREHTFIFHKAGIEFDREYPLLRRMIDYYADAKFGPESLRLIISEIDAVLPRISAMKTAVEALQEFRDVCIAARDTDLMVFVYCD